MKVLVGLSGGPESLVTAWLLKKQGMQVRGVYFDLTGDPALSEKIGLLERKLGISVQVVPSKENFSAQYTQVSQQKQQSGQLVDPRSYFHTQFLFPKLFELRKQYQYSHVATGHRALLQEDQVAKVSRVQMGSDTRQGDAVFLLGQNQEELQTVILPLGSIPVSMLSKLSTELNPSEEILSLDYKWDTFVVKSFTDNFEIIDLKGSRRIGMVKPGQRMIPGSHYHVAETPEIHYRVIDIVFHESRVYVLPLTALSISEILFEEISWFSLGDLKLKSLECGMLGPAQERTTPVKLIQFEGRRVKGFLDKPLKGSEVNLYKGQTVLWLDGSEILGGGRILGLK